MQTPKKRVLIVIPTYNEKENVAEIINKVDLSIGGTSVMLFVDDASPDGTGVILEGMKSSNSRIYVMHRPGKDGLGRAYAHGLSFGVKNGYDYIFEMDADLSHDPEYLKVMLKEFDNFDVVIGSRFMGSMENINATPFRRFISFFASRYVKYLLGLKCLDPMAGFVGYKKEVLEKIDFDNFFSKGYVFQAEIKFRCQRNGFKITEVPIIFKNRSLGDFKLRKRDMIEALVLPWKVMIFG